MRKLVILLALTCAAAWGAPAAAQVSVATQVVTAPDGQLGDAFGRRVAMSGSRMIIGASGDDDRAVD
jgi:hypothetical protein